MKVNLMKTCPGNISPQQTKEKKCKYIWHSQNETQRLPLNVLSNYLFIYLFMHTHMYEIMHAFMHLGYLLNIKPRLTWNYLFIHFTLMHLFIYLCSLCIFAFMCLFMHACNCSFINLCMHTYMHRGILIPIILSADCE